MSTKRDAPSKPGTGKRGETVTRAKIDAQEERLLRMRYGLDVSDDHPLEQKGVGHPAVTAKLREIEQRAFERSGRLAAMRAEAGVPAPAGEEQAKSKIIDRLKSKATKSKRPAKVVEKATVKASRTSAPKKKR